jgi:NAD(P)-dependent dehydrogenase (short-subunit alcohol dehydrogenase family)
MLSGKVVLVTGGGRGLGAALCGELAAQGASPVAVDLRGAEARAVADAITSSGIRAHAIEADIAEEAAVQRVVGETLERFGRLDALVNNAGTDVTASLDELAVADFDRVLGTNLRGPFLFAKHALPVFRRQGGGDIVNVASTAAKRAWPNAAAYHASKWGLLGLSHALHAELRPHGIRVTAIVAGGMRTPFLLDRFPDLDPAKLQDPVQVARAVCFALAQPRETVIAEMTVLPVQETSWP